MKNKMNRYSKKIKRCRHQWKYSINNNQELRACRKCGTIEEYRKFPLIPTGWYRLVMRTDAGAKKHFGALS